MEFINKIIFVIFCCTFFSCKTKYNTPVRDTMTLSKVGDSIKKTGFIIYDSKKQFISFVESDSIDDNNFSKER